MKKGLTLCGGGSRGSYQLGAWDAFKELNLKFDVVTGTSIGALNGLMYVQGDYENCEKLWGNVDIKKVIGNGIDFEELSVKGVFLNDQFSNFFKQIIKDKGADITPFKDMLNEYLDPKKIRKSKIDFGVIATQFPLIIKEEVNIKESTDEDMFNFILASASCFPAFPIAKFNNKQYVDGGYTDNLPIEFAFKLGATEVLAIDLDHNIAHEQYLNNPFVDYIYPKWDLGSMLYFQQETIQRNRLLGYYDVLKYFNKYDGFKYTFKKNKINENISKGITNEIINDVIYANSDALINNTLINNRKKTLNFFKQLNEHIYTKATHNDYFIKCVEALLLFFEYEPSEVYDIEDCIKKIIKEIESIDISNVEFSIKSISRIKNFASKNSHKELIAYLNSIEIEYEDKINILEHDLDLYLALVLVNKYKKKNK